MIVPLRRLSRALSLILLLVACAAALRAPAHAQDASRIEAIRIEGNARIEEGTVRSYLPFDIGDPYRPEDIDEALRQLFATGLFDDVQIARDGATVLVRVVENPIINQIAFEGNQRIDDETLAQEIQLRPRVVFSRARVQNAVTRIIELYQRNGRFAATVEPKIIERPQNRVDLVFEINEGPRTNVARIVFLGNEAFADSTLRGAILTTESAFWRVFTDNDTYDEDRLEFDKELLRRFYLARGYAEFAVNSAIAELTEDGSAFFITFSLTEGPRYDFGSIDLDSRVRDLDPEQLRQLIETEPGEVFNAEQIQSTVLAMTERLGELGYAFAEVQPQTAINRDDNTVAISYVVDEGARVFVERINITGNVRTLDEVIRREFRLAEGDAFNTTLLERSEQRVRNLGYFDSVEVEVRPGGAPDRSIIDVNVTEASTGELTFGAGFSTSDGPLGDVRLSERNLLGRGQELSLRATISGRRQEFDLSFTEPYFLQRDLAAGFDIFHRTTDFQDESSFDERNTGFTLRAGYPLAERLRHSVRYTLRQDEIRGVDNDASVFIQDEADTFLTSSIGQTLTYDRRNTRFLPSEGYVLRLEQDLAGLGGDTQFIRHEGLASYYYSIVPDVVVNLTARGGHVTGIGEDVRLSNRFFLGGANLRGFQFAGIGPRDDVTDDALGGNLFAAGTAELRFPLGLPDDLRVFGRSFVDVGTLTNVDVDEDLPGGDLIDSGNLRAAAGLGLSWLSPLGPIAIDYAVPFLEDQEDETEAFRISFGTRF